MKKILAVGMTLVCVMLCGCDNSPTSEQFPQEFAVSSFTEKELHADVNFLVNVLERNHKWLYSKVYWAEYEWDMEFLKEDITAGLNDIQFYYEICRLLAKIGDGKTKPIAGLSEDVQYKIPFTVMRLTEGYYIESIDKEHEEYLGWCLAAIDGVEVKKLKSKLSEYIPYHNEVSLWRNLGENLNDYWLLFCAGIVEDTEVELTLSKDGETVSITLEACSASAFKDVDVVALEVPQENMKQDVYYYLERQEDILYFQYNIADTDPEYPMRVLLEDLEKDLYECRAFVIDLRYNDGLTGRGGNLPIINDVLVGYVENGGKVYCLIGNGTGGTVVDRALKYRRDLGATLVGESTIDSRIYFNELGEFALPYSGITFQYPTKRTVLLGTSIDDELEPDVAVVHTIEDYLAGIDRDMETVRELLNN